MALVLSSLNSYHKANGGYPESLQDLVPDHIAGPCAFDDLFGSKALGHEGHGDSFELSSRGHAGDKRTSRDREFVIRS